MVRFTLSTFEKRRVKDGVPKLYECLTDARGPSSAVNNSQAGMLLDHPWKNEP